MMITRQFVPSKPLSYSLVMLIMVTAQIAISQTIHTDYPQPSDGSVLAIVVSGNTIYMAGSFHTVNSTTRNHIAAFNATTKALLSWDPNVNGGVNTIAISGSTVYIGGDFTTVGGSTTRNRIAAIDASTGIATAWDPNANGIVNTIAISSSYVYAGGSFTTIGGASRSNIAQLNPSPTGTATSWNPGTDSYVTSIVYDGGVVIVGGNFTTIGSTARNYCAMITESGTVQSFNPNPDNLVENIISAAYGIYICGKFSLIGVGGERTSRAGIAAVDGFGSPKTWAPSINVGGAFDMRVMAVSGSLVYVGGDFGNGASPRYIVAIDASGNKTSWNPSVNQIVYALALDLTNGWVAAGYFDALVGITNSSDAALPVELVSFNASTKSNHAELYWNTASEVNNYGFEIERRKIQSPDWAKIDYVPGNGTSNSPHSYKYTDGLVTSGRYTYRLKQIDNSGTFKYSHSVEIEIGVPNECTLSQNFPNPYNPSTTIEYSIPQQSSVTVKIFDLLGREVATLVNEKKDAGWYSVQWDASARVSGIYFYSLQAGEYRDTKRMILLK